MFYKANITLTLTNCVVSLSAAEAERYCGIATSQR